MDTMSDKPHKRTELVREQTKEVEMWVVSGDPALCERIEQLTRGMAHVRQIRSEQVLADEFWQGRPEPPPAVVVLDIDADPDWGANSIHRIRQVRMGEAIIVLTRDFSREFGAKIISQGIRYYFAREFSEEEFLAVIESLLKIDPT
jgi:DNA-binding NarL/FixJ family response regulator